MAPKFQVGDTMRHMWTYEHYKVLALCQTPSELRVRVRGTNDHIVEISPDILRFVFRPTPIDPSPFISPHYFQD